MHAFSRASSPDLHTPLEQILRALLGGIALLAATLLLALGIFELAHLGAIYPGVTVGGVPVGGLSVSEASARLTSQISYPVSGRIVFQDGENVWLANPGQLGLYLDASASAQKALAYGRTGSITQRLSDQLAGLLSGAPLSPSLLYNEQTAVDYLSNLATQIDKPVIEADLGVQGTEVVVHSGETGRQVDIPATLALLQTYFAGMQEGVIILPIRITEPLIMDPTEAADQARRIISEPLVLRLPEGQTNAPGPWTISPADLAAMLAIKRVDEGNAARFQIGLDNGALTQLLARLAPDIQAYPQNARFIFNDDTRQLDLIQPAVIGRTLNVSSSLSHINERLAAGDHAIDLQLNLTNPTILSDTTGESLGITELVMAYTSHFRGSTKERIQNITAAAGSFHGLLVAPGEEFNMASALGDISLDNGYAEAVIIVGDQSIKGVGGGVCQVSTTLFRTAFFAGFPVTERHAHAYRVGYYEQTATGHDASLAGLDATVFVPLVDFKFVNDTPYWLLMETYVNPSRGTLTWKFYSTRDGRSVEWDTTGPTNIVKPPEVGYIENPDLAKDQLKQVDWAAEGADITVTRRVMRDGALYFSDTFYTHYQAWQEKWEYGPGTEIPPKPSPKSQ
jgi:vancomycin resistance protein YoaR